MNTPRPCGCKGLRSCFTCEKEYNIVRSNTINTENRKYIYCYTCNKAWPGWNVEDNPHEEHLGEPIDYPGIYIEPNFLSTHEEDDLLEALDSMPWSVSQSGRRKQNFGPKCNFKKRKISSGSFKGFPIKTKFVQDKFQSVAIMKDFKTIEQCSLEYNSQTGAHIDPHIDDCWIWGERIVTVNLLSDSILTMTYNNKPDKYNLDCIKTYPSILSAAGNFNTTGDIYKIKPLEIDAKYPIIRIPMLRRSLLILYGSARYDWEHQVLRKDISNRRVCLAYREFTPPYLNCDKGTDILNIAKNFYELF